MDVRNLGIQEYIQKYIILYSGYMTTHIRLAMDQLWDSLSHILLISVEINKHYHYYYKNTVCPVT